MFQVRGSGESISVFLWDLCQYMHSGDWKGCLLCQVNKQKEIQSWEIPIFAWDKPPSVFMQWLIANYGQRDEHRSRISYRFQQLPVILLPNKPPLWVLPHVAIVQTWQSY